MATAPVESEIAVQEGARSKAVRTVRQVRGGVDVETEVITEAPWTIAMSYDENNLLVYVGWADMGTGKAEAKWRICKLSYTGSNPTDLQWADGDDSFDNVWNNRESLSYS